ncbi:MAG: M16 family metallopeptidase [Bdellovibrionota bacterium]
MVEFTNQKLSSGLDVVLEYNPDCSSCAVGYFVKAGSRNETIKIAGISHFLEHMSFKGTSNRSAADISFDMGSLGARANAFTSEEFTVYYGAVIPENLVAFLDILTDMQKPLFDKKEFDLEKQVILEEIALYKDVPEVDLLDLSYQNFFTDHPMGNSVIGTSETIKGVQVEDMKAYHASLYACNNVVLAVAGNFDRKALEDYIETAQSRLNPPSNIVHPKKAFKPIKKERVFVKNNLTQAHSLFLVNGASVYDDDKYELSVLANIIGDSTGSKLYWELLYQGICEDVSVYSDERLDGGAIVFYASSTRENQEKVKQALLKHINSLDDFTDEELERAKTKIMSNITFSSETPFSRLVSLGTHYHFLKEEHNVNKIIERIRKITKNDVKRAISKLDLENIGSYSMVGDSLEGSIEG